MYNNNEQDNIDTLRDMWGIINKYDCLFILKNTNKLTQKELALASRSINCAYGSGLVAISQIKKLYKIFGKERLISEFQHAPNRYRNGIGSKTASWLVEKAIEYKYPEGYNPESIPFPSWIRDKAIYHMIKNTNNKDEIIDCIAKNIDINDDVIYNMVKSAYNKDKVIDRMVDIII